MYSPDAVCFLAPTESSLETGPVRVLLPFVTVTVLQMQYSGFVPICQSIFAKQCDKLTVFDLVERSVQIRNAHAIRARDIQRSVFHIDIGQILRWTALVALGKDGAHGVLSRVSSFITLEAQGKYAAA